MLRGKTVLLGVSGSIAAYKTAYLASALKKLNADVHVLMTKNATNFINPITFETLTGNKCLVDTFDRNFEFNVEHVSLAKQADVVMIAPASANVIGKLAHGIADDMLTTTVMACKCRKFIAPAMNTNMFENPVVQDNLEILRGYGYETITPAVGYLACGDTGAGKMPEPALLLEYILRDTAYEKDMEGLNVLVTAGPTQEPVDPVRYITNHSTGKMGYAIARVCMRRGANVTLVSGPSMLEPPQFIDFVPVTTAKEMFDQVTERSAGQDIIIKAAAVADYRPKNISSEKVKKKDGEMALEMERTDDILAWLGSHKRPGQFLCGFSMETENVLENSRKKLKKKNVDMIAANSLKTEGAGFGGDTNVITRLWRGHECDHDHHGGRGSFTRQDDKRGGSLKAPGPDHGTLQLNRGNIFCATISIVSRIKENDNQGGSYGEIRNRQTAAEHAAGRKQDQYHWDGPDGDIRCDHNHYGVYPFSRIYSAWIYPGDDPARPGHYRVPVNGTQKRRGAGIFIRTHQFYQQHDESDRHIICIHAVLQCG